LHRFLPALARCVLTLTVVAVPAARADLPASVEALWTEEVRIRMESDAADGIVLARGESLTSVESLRRFYVDRFHAPLWLDERAFGRRVEAMRAAIRAASAHGLRPRDYHLAALETLGPTPPADPAAAVGAELLLSDAWLRLASHLLHGKVDPRTIHPSWTASRRERDLPALMASAVGEGRIGEALAELAPRHPDYRLLVDALARLRALREAGGFTPVPVDEVLREGVRGPAVLALRARLEEAGEAVDASDPDPEAFGPALTEAMRRVQERLGLEADGVAGARTLAALNVPVQSRIDSILASLERFRWLPDDLGERHVLVNVAGFWLRLEIGGRAVLEMPVVVGRDYRQTPVFSSTISYVVVNPSWEIPQSIARRDKVPDFQRDPAAMVASGYEVLEGWGQASRPLDPSAIDWAALRGQPFPFRMRQRPGPENALGRVKFMFPNEHSVYLHDSPARELFARSERGFSSGCVRLEQPLELLFAIFEGSEWTRSRLEALLESGTETTVPLPADRRVAVHLLYWTAWVDPENRIQYRRDVYGRDARLLVALREDERPLD
jgi:murein L,D-transpeptidase YcbB/YkuD